MAGKAPFYQEETLSRTLLLRTKADAKIKVIWWVSNLRLLSIELANNADNWYASLIAHRMQQHAFAFNTPEM